MKRLLLIFALLSPSPAMAQTEAPLNTVRTFKVNGAFEVLDDVALNAAAGTRTYTALLKKAYTKLTVLVFYTWATGTTVTITPSVSIDGTRFAPMQTRACAAGVCTLNPWVDTKNVTASIDFTAEFDVSGAEQFELVFGGAGVGGSDLVDVHVFATVGN